jgi:hypothetical protein
MMHHPRFLDLARQDREVKVHPVVDIPAGSDQAPPMAVEPGPDTARAFRRRMEIAKERGKQT